MLEETEVVLLFSSKDCGLRASAPSVRIYLGTPKNKFEELQYIIWGEQSYFFLREIPKKRRQMGSSETQTISTCLVTKNSPKKIRPGFEGICQCADCLGLLTNAEWNGGRISYHLRAKTLTLASTWRLSVLTKQWSMCALWFQQTP